MSTRMVSVAAACAALVALIDGREAVTFLKRIKSCVEQPARMLVEV